MARNPLSDVAKARGRALKARLKAARGARPQEDIAHAAGLRLSTLKAIEDPNRSFQPSFFAVADLARAVGIEFDELDAVSRVPSSGGGNP